MTLAWLPLIPRSHAMSDADLSAESQAIIEVVAAAIRAELDGLLRP